MTETYEFLARGGPVMVIIALCSVISLTIFVERLWALQRSRVIPTRLVHLIRQLVSEGRFDEARSLCTSNESAIASVLLAGLKQVHQGRAIMREAMQDRGRREIAELERFTGALGAIATIAPLLGLLGTITGMIKTFQQVNESVAITGQMSPGALANGIWEALITTAAGLTVAIPAYLAYRFVMARIDRSAGDMEEISIDILDSAMTVSERSGATRTEQAETEPPKDVEA